MSSAEQYQRYAAECLRLAQQAETASEKGLLLEMAEHWRRLAENNRKKFKND
jgi:hypothetical protein